MRPGLRKFFHENIAAFLTSTLLAVFFAQLAVTWTLICGTASSSLIVFFAAVAAAFFSNSSFPRISGRALRICVGLLLVVAAFSYPSILDTALTIGVRLLPGSTIGSFVVPGVCAFSIAAVLLGLVFASPEKTPSPFVRLSGFAFGSALMLCHGLMPFPLAVTTSVLIVLVVATRIWKPALTDEGTPSSLSIPRFLSFVGTGMLLFVSLRWASFYFSLTIDVLCLGAAMMCVLLAATRVPFVSRFFSMPLVALSSIVAIASLPLMSTIFVDLNLWINAGQHGGIIVLLLRALQVGILLTLSIVSCLRNDVAQNASFRDVGFAVSGFTMAFALAGWLPLVCLIAAFAVAYVAFAMTTPGWRRLDLASTNDDTQASSKSVYRRFAAHIAGCVAVVLVVCFLPSSVTSNTDLLFSSRATNAYRMGVPAEMVRQSGSRRFLEEIETPDGRLTAWRTSGDRLELRKNGQPLANATVNPSTSPQPIADALTTVIPLVLHRNAQSTLLLGDYAGVGVNTCVNFPLQEIVVVHPNSVTTETAERLIWEKSDDSPFADERVQVRHQPVSQIIRRAKAESWDVIICDAGSVASPSLQSQFTTDFYRHVRRQLHPGGVFCQRLPQYELGAEPLIRILSTASMAFDRLVLLRLDVGELALVGGGESLLDKDLLTRLQRSHVSQQLGRSGWDWSQVAALPVIDSSDPVGLLEHVELLPAADASNAFLPLSITTVANGSSDKNAELRKTFAPHQRRLADAAPKSKVYAEFARRYTSVIQQSEILSAFPDMPWPYRNSLKSEMQRNPRPPIEVVVDGRTVKKAHPLDERRKNYFIALGNALEQARSGFVSPDAMKNVAAFCAVNEPLLSHFAHHELIRIHEATGHPSPAIELRHRLHSVYFTDSADLSVRQVADAMEQLLDDPELLPTVALRYDHLNSLLQELVNRWEGRRGADPSSARKTQSDVDKCVRVANKALDAMEEWSQVVDLSADDLRLRRRFVNRALISPLREYREQVLAHRIKTEEPAEEYVDSDELPILASPQSLTTN